MSAPGTLVLLRHEQGVLNVQDRFMALLDPPLSRGGEEEAVGAGARLTSVSFSPDAVYTSVLTRTRDTTDTIGEDQSLPNGSIGTHLNDADPSDRSPHE